MKKVILCIVWFFISVGSTRAQWERWVYRYNGPGNGQDEAHSVVLGVDSDVYAAGTSTGYEGGPDFTVISLTSAGGERWVYRYDGPGNYLDLAHSIVMDAGGNLYAAGHSTGIGTDFDFTVISLTSAGGERWIYRYDGPGSHTDDAWSIVMDADGNLYAAGNSAGIGTGHDFTVISLTSAGGERWIYRYNGPGNYEDHAYSIGFGADGNLYAAGYSAGIGTDLDFTVISLTSAGGERWVYRYDGPGSSSDRARSIVMDADGNLYAAGYSTGIGTVQDFTVISLTSAGGERWVYRYDGPGSSSDRAYSIVMDPEGNLYAAGHSIGSGTSYDFTVVSLTSIVEPFGTAYPNGRKLARVPNRYDLWITYEDAGEIYVAYSPDGGITFPDEWCLGTGGFPTIALTQYSGPGGTLVCFPVVVWAHVPQYPTRLYCARLQEEVWETGSLYTDPFGWAQLPSLVIEDSLAHLVWETFGGPVGNKRYLRYGTFLADDDNWPPPSFSAESPLDEEFSDDWVMAPCIDYNYHPASSYAVLHVVYKKGDDVYYMENWGEEWSTAEMISRTEDDASSFPFVDAYGDSVYAVWHAHSAASPADEVWYRSKYTHQPWNFDYWNVSIWPAWPDRDSQFPCIVADHASYSQDWPPTGPLPNWEIAMKEKPFTGDPVNISETENTHSMWCHTNYMQLSGEPHYLFFLWTEVEPGQIMVTQYQLNHPAVPYYYVQTGQEEPSPYCVERDSFVQFGPEAYQQVDIDADQLVYRLPGLMPWMRHRLVVTAYWEGADELTERLDIDGLASRLITLEPGVPETLTVWIPPAAYEDDREVNVTITLVSGEWALTGPMILYQFEKEEGEGGPQAVTTSAVDPTAPVLSQNYPNPVRDRTTIGYQLSAPGHITLRVYDIAGRPVATLANREKSPGYHTATWNGMDGSGKEVPNGVYFYRLTAGDFSLTKKLVVLR